MGGIIQVDTIQNNNTSTLIAQTNTTTITIARSGQTVVIPSGTTFNASSASVNLPAINLATGVTGTLPYTSGGTGLTTLGTAGQALVVNSGATALQYSTVGATAGTIIQVKTATDSTERSTTSTSWQTSSTLSISITPSSTSNTILLMLFNFYTYSSGGNTAVSIFKDSTNLGDATYGLFGQQDDTLVRPFSYSYLDSPSSTSAITYQIRYRAYNYGSGTINKSPQGASATTTARLVAMEIKG
jgi:hypothetical protein